MPPLAAGLTSREFKDLPHSNLLNGLRKAGAWGPNGPGQGAVATANVRLIAAASKLLDALQDMLDQFRGRNESAAVRTARVVIAKAQGQMRP